MASIVLLLIKLVTDDVLTDLENQLQGKLRTFHSQLAILRIDNSSLIEREIL